jgi:hypothetical protein
VFDSFGHEHLQGLSHHFYFFTGCCLLQVGHWHGFSLSTKYDSYTLNRNPIKSLFTLGPASGQSIPLLAILPLKYRHLLRQAAWQGYLHIELDNADWSLIIDS